MASFAVPSPLSVGDPNRRALEALARRIPTVTTSTARPKRPELGDVIIESNTGQIRMWNGTIWAYQGAWSSAGRLGSSTSGTVSVANASPVTAATFLAATSGLYAVTGWIGWGVSPGSVSRASLLVASAPRAMTPGDISWGEVSVSWTGPVTAGQAVSLTCYQDSGATIVPQWKFDVVHVSP